MLAEERLSVAALAAVALLLGACAGRLPRVERPSEAALAEGRAGAVHFRDEIDGGNDIWNGGCHFEYADPACTQNRALFVGDWCDTWKDLVEWTLRDCHDATGDQVTADCNQECRLLGWQRGFCQTLANHCAPNRDSARCVCAGPPPPGPGPDPSAAASEPLGRLFGRSESRRAVVLDASRGE